MEYQELELKYYVHDLARIERLLIALGAICDQPRTREINLRFDTPDNSLSYAGKALRLRYDTQARLTFKGPSQSQEGIRLREEIEFVVDNFQAAQTFLIALGYQISIIYEKYRTTYQLNDCLLMLDELPFGNFLEIEGKDAAAIKKTAVHLHLNWDMRIKMSYLAIFYRLKEKFGLKANNLVFSEVTQTQITTEDLLSVLSNDR